MEVTIITPAAPAHVRASSGILLVIVSLGAVVAIILVSGGIYLAIAERFAETTFSLFGNDFASTSVGVSMAFMGVVLAGLTFNRVLSSLRYINRLPKDPG